MWWLHSLNYKIFAYKLKAIGHCKMVENEERKSLESQLKFQEPKVATQNTKLVNFWFLEFKLHLFSSISWLKPSTQFMIRILEIALTSVSILPYTLHPPPPQRSQNITPLLFQKLKTSNLLSTWRSCSEHHQSSGPTSGSQNLFQRQGKLLLTLITLLKHYRICMFKNII